MKTPTVLKRKKSGVTDYRKRLKLLRSESTRIIIRPTGKGIVVQAADYSPEGDKVIATVNSSTLKKEIGVTGNNSQVAYLAGYYLGKLASSRGVEYAVVDTGRFNLVTGGRISCAIKGAIDGGLEISASEDIYPSEERIEGKHLKSPLDISNLKNAIDGKVK
ncbi:MAG: 50S ribosomal protein L18 [Candidatus Thermoplasmatota archaeon]|jgi:large subunit ribosomal protein L18|nr:50S ribosomal protein L18 [Candidatus Thermoplasmatota archaeon]